MSSSIRRYAVEVWQSGRPADYTVLAAMVAPNLVWALLHRGLWTSDEALYGLSAVRLYAAAASPDVSWWQTMLSVGPKPPLLPWVAQFLVPVGSFAGHVEAALLLVSVGAGFASLSLVYEIARASLSDRAIALLAALILAAAPVFVTMGKTFYVQPLQLAAVCWLILVMVRSSEWDPVFAGLQLIAAGSFALMTTLATPVFCVLPVLIAVKHMYQNRDALWTFDRRHTVMALAALLLSMLSIVWLARHFGEARAYAAWSFGYVFGGISGIGYSMKLTVWTALTFFGLVVALPLAILAVAFVACRLWRHRGDLWAAQGIPVVVLVSLAQVAGVLALFALSAQQTPRYVLPLMSYLALVVAWAIQDCAAAWPKRLAAALTATQLVTLNLFQFGLVEPPTTLAAMTTGPDGGSFVSTRFEGQRGRGFELVEIISETTADAGASPVLLATGRLGLFNLNVRFHARASDPSLSPLPQRFDSLEFRLTGDPEAVQVGADLDDVWRTLNESMPAYAVLESRAVRGGAASDQAHGWDQIIDQTIELSQMIANSSAFERVPVAAASELEFYRRVESTR